MTSYWRIGEQITDLFEIFSKWNLGLDILDLSLGRSYYVGTCFTVTPFVSAKAAWINQKANIKSAKKDNKYQTRVSSKSWFLGPQAGVETNWFLAEGFRFFSNASSALFYQHFSLLAKEYEIKNPITYTTNASDKLDCINASISLAMGFGWGKYFNYNNLHFDVQAGYEMQLFWNQNQMRSFVEELKNKVYSKPGNLTPHGFTLTMRLDF